VRVGGRAVTARRAATAVDVQRRRPTICDDLRRRRRQSHDVALQDDARTLDGQADLGRVTTGFDIASRQPTFVPLPGQLPSPITTTANNTSTPC